MSKSRMTLLSLGLALGLLLVALAGAAKPPAPVPPPTCPTCPIVYIQTTSSQNRSDLMLMQADGSAKTAVLVGARGVRYDYPAWSPDGEWIAVSSNRGDSIYRLWLVRWDGKVAIPAIATCSGNLTRVAWRPVPTPGTSAYWLVYWDHCEGNTVDYGLWAVQVDFSAGTPSVATERYCLTCTDELLLYYWGRPDWTSDGMHLSAERSVSEPYSTSFVVFDFVDSAPPRLENGRAADFSDMAIDWVWPGKWAHGRNRLVAHSHLPQGYLWWFDVDHDAPSMITDWGALTPEDGWGYSFPAWSTDDQRLIYAARSADGWGLFVSDFNDAGPINRPAVPIAPSTYKGQANSPDWNPNPNPPR